MPWLGLPLVSADPVARTQPLPTGYATFALAEAQISLGYRDPFLVRLNQGKSVTKGTDMRDA